MKNKGKLLIFSIIVIILIIILYFFYTNNYKTIKTGNNIGKSAEEIKNYILNISSYQATINLNVKSNKNENNYIIKQKYSQDGNLFKQEIIEPENIKGLITTYDGQNLKIENTNLGLSNLYENYKFIAENSLCLNSFVEEYKNSQNTSLKEEGNKIVFTVKSENMVKTLYVDIDTAKPEKMEIQVINQKLSAYIQYKEIELNKAKKEEIIAFKTKKGKKEI